MIVDGSEYWTMSAEKYVTASSIGEGGGTGNKTRLALTIIKMLHTVAIGLLPRTPDKSRIEK